MSGGTRRLCSFRLRCGMCGSRPGTTGRCGRVSGRKLDCSRGHLVRAETEQGCYLRCVVENPATFFVHGILETSRLPAFHRVHRSAENGRDFRPRKEQ
jgi:hypothetical protein